MILKPKPCSFQLQSYGCYKNHFCIHVNGDVNFDKLVHENMFTRLFPKLVTSRRHAGFYMQLASHNNLFSGKN